MNVFIAAAHHNGLGIEYGTTTAKYRPQGRSIASFEKTGKHLPRGEAFIIAQRFPRLLNKKATRAKAQKIVGSGLNRREQYATK